MYPVYLLLGGVCFGLMFFVVVEIDLGVTSDIFTVLFLGNGLMFLFEGLADYRGQHERPSAADREEAHRVKLQHILRPATRRRRRELE